MKKTVLFIFYIAAVVTVSAQNLITSNKDTLSNGLNLKAFKLNDIQVPNTFFNRTDTFFTQNNATKGIHHNMPIIKPGGNYGMVSYPFDTSKKYSLLIFEPKNAF